MELYNKLRVLRKLKGLTQQNISEQFYISRQAVQKWESGESSPDITKLPELAELFGITVDDLLNPKLNEQLLLKKALSMTEMDLDTNPNFMGIVRKASTIDWIIFSTILFGTAIVVILLHLLGISVATLSILSSLTLAGIGVYSLVNTTIEIQQGIPTFFFNVGIGVVGIILSYLSYKFFVWFISTYIKFVKNATLRFRDYGVIKGMFYK